MKWHEIYKNQTKQANKSLENLDKELGFAPSIKVKEAVEICLKGI